MSETIKICEKCGYSVIDELLEYSFEDKTLNKKVLLCTICKNYLPSNPKYVQSYLNEKIDWKTLETFRKSTRSVSELTKKGMQKAKNEGKAINRPPLGYKILNGKMVVDEEKILIVKKIYEDNKNGVGLREMARRHNMSPSGIKKILENKIYNL